jgi:hypothetical protein
MEFTAEHKNCKVIPKNMELLTLIQMPSMKSLPKLSEVKDSPLTTSQTWKKSAKRSSLRNKINSNSSLSTLTFNPAAPKNPKKTLGSLETHHLLNYDKIL